MGSTTHVRSVEEFQAFAAANVYVAAFFWAEWSEPSKVLQEALDEVMAANSKLCCAKVGRYLKLLLVWEGTRQSPVPAYCMI